MSKDRCLPTCLKFVFEMSDASHLDTVLSAVRKVEGVFDVYRISGG
jgi:guanosine-3',5'-bis(diphosphate) 3'-pyrophosphohydrolase